MTFNVQVEIHDDELRRLVVNFPQRVDAAIAGLAFDGQAWLQDAFGQDGSPSSPGGIPGIDTGTLKNSISVNPAGFLARAIGAAADYALHLEFGTSRMEARPYMGPLSHWLESVAEQSMRNQLRF